MVKVKDAEDGGDLEIDFVDCGELDVIRMDSLEHKRNMGALQRVDCVALPPSDPCLLIEFKDPSRPSAKNEDDHRKFIMKILDDDYTAKSLAPKCMHTLRYVIKIRPDRLTHEFYTIMGIERLIPLGFNKQLLLAITAKLRNQLSQEKGMVPKSSAVMAIDDWNQRVPQYPVRRISTTAGATP